MKYRIYIDETGNSDLGSCSNPNHRFLSLTGVIVELSHVRDVLHPEMEALKMRYFNSHPDDPVIFHRKEMMNHVAPFDVLVDEKLRASFDTDILRLMKTWDYRVLSVCLDKKRHVETYITWRYEPYHYCMAVLMERFVFFLKRQGAQGDVMAESRGGKEDMRLKDSFHRLWEHGTDYVEPEQFQNFLTSGQLKVKSKSNNIAGLQLADLLAHPSRNEMLDEQKLLVGNLAPFAKQVIEVLTEKYDRQGTKLFGKKFI